MLSIFGHMCQTTSKVASGIGSRCVNVCVHNTFIIAAHLYTHAHSIIVSVHAKKLKSNNDNNEAAVCTTAITETAWPHT